MNANRRWIPYDTFKLIVTLVLLALLLVLLLRRPAGPPVVGQAGQETAAATTQAPAEGQPPTATPTPLPPPATLAPTASPTLPPPTASPTLPLPTATLEAEVTPTGTPETEAAAAPTATPHAEATPTETPPAEATLTPTPEPQAGAADCPLAQPSRLAVGNQAVVRARLNLRSEAGMDKTIIRVSPPGTQVEVISGPMCIPYQGGAYLWWNLETADGVTGWSAEASLTDRFYFLEPLP
jgi:hypothetical protein